VPPEAAAAISPACDWQCRCIRGSGVRCLPRIIDRSKIVVVVVLTAATACAGWENTYRGTAAYTAAAGPDGKTAHDTIEGTVVVSVCGPGSAAAVVRAGSDCTLRGVFGPDETGGAIVVSPGGVCSLSLGRGPVNLRVTSGVVTMKGDVTDVTICGSVAGPEGTTLHADYRWSGQRTSVPQDPHCDK
jgi:hypothetical protein